MASPYPPTGSAVSSTEMVAIPEVDLQLWALVTDWIARSLCTKNKYDPFSLSLGEDTGADSTFTAVGISTSGSSVL